MNSIPADKPVLFLPDLNLGNYVRKQTGRENMKIWQGACIVHATFPARRVVEAQSEHPEARSGGASGVPGSGAGDGGFYRLHVGASSIGARASDAREFIVMTESGVRYSLEQLAPRKKFYFVANENCNCSECPYMRLNTLEKLRDALQNLEPRVELTPELMRRALRPIERMLAVK